MKVPCFLSVVLGLVAVVLPSLSHADLPFPGDAQFIITARRIASKTIICRVPGSKAGFVVKVSKKKSSWRPLSKASFKTKTARKKGMQKAAEFCKDEVARKGGLVGVPTATPTPTPTPIPPGNSTPLPTPTPLPECGAIVSPQSEEGFAKISITLPLVAEARCGRTVVGFMVSVPPTKGSVVIDGSVARYISETSGHEDSFQVRAIDNIEVGPPTSFSVEVLQEFSGNGGSLAPYRDRLSPREVSAILNKVAFGGNDQLRQIGITKGREALITALLDEDTTGPDLTLIGVSAEAHALERAAACLVPVQDPPVFSNESCNWLTLKAQNPLLMGQWHGDSMRNYVYAHFLKNNPLPEYMSFLLHDHFATSFDGLNSSSGGFTVAGYALPQHWQLIRSQALGNFLELTKGMVTDVLMSHWLDNRVNVVSSINENFAREFLELFTVYQYDPYTNLPNYPESTVRELARAFTGFTNGWYFGQLTNYPRLGPETAIPVSSISGQLLIPQTHTQGVGWHRDLGMKTLFEGSEYEQTGTFNPTVQASGYQLMSNGGPAYFATSVPAVDAVLGGHPNGGYLAYKLFSHIAYSHPSQSIYNALKTTFVESGFEMRPVVQTILSSSALLSQAARHTSIKSPTEAFMTFLRVTNMHRYVRSTATYKKIIEVSQKAAHLMGAPPTVFAWMLAGDNMNNTINLGETWLGAQKLLERQNGIVALIDQLVGGEGFEILSLLPTPTASPAELVEALTIRFDVELNGAQRAILLNYLDGKIEGLPDRQPWDLAELSRTRSRIAGVLYIIANLPQAQLR